LCCSIN